MIECHCNPSRLYRACKWDYLGLTYVISRKSWILAVLLLPFLMIRDDSVSSIRDDSVPSFRRLLWVFWFESKWHSGIGWTQWVLTDIIWGLRPRSCHQNFLKVKCPQKRAVQREICSGVDPFVAWVMPEFRVAKFSNRLYSISPFRSLRGHEQRNQTSGQNSPEVDFLKMWAHVSHQVWGNEVNLRNPNFQILAWLSSTMIFTKL